MGDNYDGFWASLREYISTQYRYVTGRLFPEEDVPLHPAYIPTIFETVKKSSDDLDTKPSRKKWRSFLIRFTNPDFHKDLEWLFSESARLGGRIEWFERVKSIINFLTIAVITTALLCLFSLVLLVHSNILWSYVLALLAIILFIYLTSRAIFLAKKSSGISLVKEMLCLLICVIVSLVVICVYIGALVVPRISESTGHQHTALKAFKGDESFIPSFLNIFGPEPSKKEVLQESDEPSKDANSTSDGSNEKMDPTGGGPTKIKGVDTGHEDYKSKEKSPSDKAPLKIDDALNPESLTKAKNKG